MSKKTTMFSAAEIDSFRRGGKILRGCLDHVATLVKPGITTGALDVEAEKYIRDHGGLPAFKGYRGFPGTLCTSVNEECVHGIPGPRKLTEGDIVSLDCGVLMDRLYTDACVTVPVGTVSDESTKLLAATEEALKAAVRIARAGIRVGDISSTIEAVIRGHGFVPVRALTGHGLGYNLHQVPDIPNLGKAGTGPVLPAGIVVAIEPIVSAGSDDVRQLADGWTLVISDGGASAHFEHSLLITDEGCEVLA
jgi:methionyl aminopeptidase